MGPSLQTPCPRPTLAERARRLVERAITFDALGAADAEGDRGVVETTAARHVAARAGIDYGRRMLATTQRWALGVLLIGCGTATSDGSARGDAPVATSAPIATSAPAATASTTPVASAASAPAVEASAISNPTATCKADTPAVADAEGIAFIESLAGRLDVELTESPVRISPKLMNEKAPRTAKIKSLSLDVYIFSSDYKDSRPLTDAERKRIVFKGSTLQLRGLGKAVKHTAADCIFTVEDVLAAVEETERQTRAQSEWFDGIDVHHVYFEGVHRADDGVWEIGWGS